MTVGVFGRGRWLALVAVILHAARLVAQSEVDAPPAQDSHQQVDFAHDVLPILKAHCHACHGANLRESNYRLDVKAAALGSGDSGAPAILPGQSAGSRLIQYVSGTDPDGILMPPQDEGQPLSEQQIAVLRRWIDQGADWPDDLPDASDIKLTTDHWSFQPLRQDVPPQLDNPWVRTPIDGFVLQRLQQEGLAPSPEADRRRWVRRLYLDMLGLPPTPGEVRGVCRESRAGCLRATGRPCAGQPTLRRALGTTLAGCRAVRRIGRV